MSFTPSDPSQSGGFNFSFLQTAIQNLVQGVSAWTQTQLNINGVANSTNLTAATLVKSGAGRVCSVSVIVAGSTTGAIYDASSTANTNSAQLYTIPTTVGTVVVNMPVALGIVVVPGTGQTIAVSYS